MADVDEPSEPTDRDKVEALLAAIVGDALECVTTGVAHDEAVERVRARAGGQGPIVDAARARHRAAMAVPVAPATLRDAGFDPAEGIPAEAQAVADDVDRLLGDAAATP